MEESDKYNNKGWIKSYRTQLKERCQLTDPEFRLLWVYEHIADWDKKHKKNFGKVIITLRDIKSRFLPNWALGKLSVNRRSLINKGWLIERSRSTVELVHRVEPDFQGNENYFQKDERRVQNPENEGTFKSDQPTSINELIQKKSQEFVQPVERNKSPKETLEKTKENLEDKKSLNEKGRTLVRNTLDRLVREGKIPPPRKCPPS